MIMNQRIEESELIINSDGSVFHLHLKPGEIGDTVILVGDPDRVDLIGGMFDHIELTRRNREFYSKTGMVNGKRLSIVSTGIGTDNIDIVLNELDALVNVDFATRLVKPQHHSLNFVRIGTSGSLQRDIPVDSWLLSRKAVGFDGLLNYYGDSTRVMDLNFESALTTHLNWAPRLTKPYVVAASAELVKKLASPQIIQGVTISAPGFYGPQGRVIRLPLNDPHINEKITAFEYQGERITNYEMECSAIYGLAALMGHQAVTVCAIIANRLAGSYSKDYHPVVEKLSRTIIDKLTQ
jgi:uridine phosphorylase